MKYVPGLMVGQLSGKAGSTVAARGRFGSYFRTRNMPTDPNTIPQQKQRDILTAASKYWGASLTEIQRSAWDSAALSIAKTDSLGSTYYQSGFDYFCSSVSNVSLYAGSLNYVSIPPIGSAPAAILTAAITASAGAGTISLAYTTTPLSGGVKMVVECTAPMSPGRKYIRKSDYRQIFVTAAAAASPANIATAYTARFGTIEAAEDKVINFRVFTINNEGLRSAYTTGTATIAA